MTGRTDLRADCAACVGLCCIVPAFRRSADFAIDKAAGVPCPNLLPDHGCGVHDRLPELGFRGCTVYDCFGAGQRAVREHDGDWVAFEALERLHELLWYLADALDRPAAHPLRAEIEGLRDLVRGATDHPHDADVPSLQRRADPLLGEVSTLVRRRTGGEDLRGRDLAGRDLRSHDLQGAGLRGAVLIGADLRDADLGEADLLGADLRGADVRGADLSDALFLTVLQVRAATTDAATQLPAWASE